jgi:dihydrofolate reductase
VIISIIAAMDQNRLIGNKNQLPWHLPADFAHFKSVTMGKPIIMGRKTYESIGKPLPGRKNIVLSRNTDLQFDGVTCVSSFDAAVAEVPDAEDTYVDAEFEGDAWFPDYDVSQWAETDSVVHQADEKNKYNCRFVTLEKN